MTKLINYQLANKNFKPQLNGGMYTYILAANGVFVYSKNDYFEALIPVDGMYPILGLLYMPVRGLLHVNPYIKTIKKVGRLDMWTLILNALEHLPNERLFFLRFNTRIYDWEIIVPAQEATLTQVKAKGDHLYSPIEVHSHNTMKAFFSNQDDSEETGLRIYAVLGQVNDAQPQIRVRVGIYGHTHDIPYTEVFEHCGFVRDVVDA